jgi:Cys-rich repeat protein
MRSARVIFALPLALTLCAACTVSTSTGGDAAPPAPDSGDAADEAVASTFRCGGYVCPASEVCCFDPMTLGLQCLARGACLNVPVACASVADCSNGEVCCATFQGVTYEVVCSSQCGRPRSFQICASDADCPAGQVCSRGLVVHLCATPFGADAASD